MSMTKTTLASVLASTAGTAAQYRAAAGSAPAPAYTFVGDPDSGLYSVGANAVGLATGGVARVRVDADGNVGVNRAPYVTSNYSTVSVQGTSGSVLELMDTAGDLFGRVYSQPTDKLVIQNSRVTGKIHFAINAADAAMIDSNRHLLVGTTALAPGYFDNTNTGFVIRSNGQFFQNAPDFSTMGRNTAGTVLAFNLASVWKGSIDLSSGGTAYLTSSDYRLKGGVVPLTDAVGRLAALKPSRFHWLEDPGVTVDGFLAHEVAVAVPEAVRGEKDATDFGGNPIYQAIDQSKLVPLLVAAVQELAARVAALEGAE